MGLEFHGKGGKRSLQGLVHTQTRFQARKHLDGRQRAQTPGRVVNPTMTKRRKEGLVLLPGLPHFPLPPSGSLSWQEKLLEKVLGSWLDSCPVLTMTCWEGLTGGEEGHGGLG